MPSWAEGLRVATFNTEWVRKGPGELLRDLSRGDAPDVEAGLSVITAARADVLLLQSVDYDLDGLTLAALQAALSQAGLDYPHAYQGRPNTGRHAGFDLDRDGRVEEPEDALGYGRYGGEGGMAMLSRYPLGEVREFTGLIWAEQPWSNFPKDYFTDDEAARLPLSSVAHWAVPVDVGGTSLTLLSSHASPPVFDGPEDRNGLRNGDEITLWAEMLDGAYGGVAAPFVVLGDLNNDMTQGEGLKPPLARLLSHPRLQDPAPEGEITVRWAGVGALRVDYVLPSAGLSVRDHGVIWGAGERASRHALVWVDIALP